MKVNGDLSAINDEMIARLQCEQGPDVQQPIHHWIQRFGEARFVVFLYQKYDQPDHTSGFLKHHILNAEQLYTTQYRMPRTFEIDGNDFEYLNSRWKKVATFGTRLYQNDPRNRLRAKIVEYDEFCDEVLEYVGCRHFDTSNEILWVRFS